MAAKKKLVKLPNSIQSGAARALAPSFVSDAAGYVPGSFNAAGNASPLAGQDIGVGASGTAGSPAGGAGYTDPYSAARAQYGTLIGNATNSANTGYKNALADSIAGEGAYGLDLGATLGARDPNLDPTAATQGSFDWNNVEASNPFSKAALLVRNYHQQQNRTTNGLASQGQLYSGAMQNQQGEDTFGFQQGQDSLGKALQNYLAGQARSRRDAGVTRDDAINNAGLTGLQSLLGS